MGYFRELWDSVFTQGVTPVQERTLDFAFGALMGINLVLLFVTRSVHFVVLQVLTAGLWWGTKWFIGEYKVALADKAQSNGEAVGEQSEPDAVAKSDAQPDTEDTKPDTKPGTKDVKSHEKPGSKPGAQIDAPIDTQPAPAETKRQPTGSTPAPDAGSAARRRARRKV